MHYDLLCTHHAVSRETYDMLAHYVELLLRWQKKINLISPNSVNEVWERHIIDGLQTVKLLEQLKKPLQIVDMGSGGGIPGLILGICLDVPLQLQESDARKCIFLETVSRETYRNNISVFNGRSENSTIKDATLVTARALAPLNTLISYAYPQLAKDGKCLFHKGNKHEEERIEARKNWHFTEKLHESITQEGSVLIEISDIRRIQ